MRIVSMCGSLGADSANQAALDVAAARLVAFHCCQAMVPVSLDDVPAFRPDLVDDPPPAVQELQAAMESADGVMVAAPEYAGGLAGVTKNALDWLVGSASIYHRPVVVLSAGTTGGQFAIEQLVRTLSWQGALVVGTLGISSPRTKTGANGDFVDPSTIEMIEQWADHLAAAVSMAPGLLLQRVTQVVTPLGIDASRFGDLR